MANQDPVVPPLVALAAPVVSKPPPALPPPLAAKPPAAPPGEPSQSMQLRLQAALEKEDQASACNRDEQRLARVRSMPSADEIVRFERELGCTRLMPQVQRLFESIATTLPAAPIPLVAAPPPPAAVPPIAASRKEEPKREEAKREEPRKKQLPATGRDMLWSPTIRAALIAGTPWLDHFLSRLRDDAPSTAISATSAGATHISIRRPATNSPWSPGRPTI